MAWLLEQDGYQAVASPKLAEILIVNTCGFIGPAREQSYQELKKLAKSKRPGQLLIAAGCLTQRYGAEVARQVPGVDGILGTRRWMDIVDVVHRLRNTPHPAPFYHLPETSRISMDMPGIPLSAVRGASAYLKIADGCRRPCAFCAIPLIKGTTVSRPMPALLNDAKILHAGGVRELILIAQDTTDYGHDLGMKDGLAIFLENLVRAVPGLDWIRILYAFPGYVTDRLIEVMASHPQILPYLDIPLQHAHPDTLTRMQRPANLDWVHATIAKMRKALPVLAIRTTFIVGYPGETDKEFQTLLDFVREMRFDRIGVFPFSFEQGTSSEPLGDPVPATIKEERIQELMGLQQTISLQINQTFVGKTMDVLIEGVDAQSGISVGRSYRDAPEIDGLVLVEGTLEPGNLTPIRITGAMVHDLAGIPAEPNKKTTS